MQLSPAYSSVRFAAIDSPSIGELAERIRHALSKDYGIVPPNLSTAIDGDADIITITAMDPARGINFQITVKSGEGASPGDPSISQRTVPNNQGTAPPVDTGAVPNAP